ncbi:unnamed protein product [Closterium sp. NIES-54]
MLSLLPESWLQFTRGLSLPQNQSLWTLEWVRTKILEEDFRRRQLRGGDDGSSGYGMQGSKRGRGRGFGGAGRGAKKDDDSNDQQGGTGWGRGAKSGRGGKSGWSRAASPGLLGVGHGRCLDDDAAQGAAPINEVCSASGHALKVAGAGRAAFKGADGKPVVLHDVLHIPDLKANLISLRNLAKAGVSTSTDGARTYKGQLGNRVLWDLHESKDVYRSMWQMPALVWHSVGQAGEGSASQGECNAVGGGWCEGVGQIWGDRLGNGTPTLGACGNALVEAAGEGWRRQGSKKFLELVHMDLVGPLPVQGHKGKRYFLTIVDDWSRLMWAYPLKQKDHAAPTIKEVWLPFVEKQAEFVVKRIRIDRGERANRTILETARALLIESGVANSMWPHAVRHATVARNRVLTKVGNESWVPLERWHGRKPPVDMLRVFGCMAVAHIPKKYRSKLGANAIWCVHLGLAAESKGWLLWEPSKDVLFDSRDVKFVEGMMYGGLKKQPETNVSEQMEQITMQLDLTPSVWEEGEEAAAEGGDGEKVQEALGSGGDDVETSDSTKEAAGKS